MAYEYGVDTQGVPAVFIANYSDLDMQYRYEFLTLNLGSNDLSETEGYVLTLFTDMKPERIIMMWTNDKPYSVVQGKLRPAFGVRRVVGEGPKRSGSTILAVLAAVSATILALWYRRSKKERLGT